MPIIDTFNQTVPTVISIAPYAVAGAAYVAKLHRDSRRKADEAAESHRKENEAALRAIVEEAASPIRAEIDKTNAVVSELKVDSQPNGGKTSRDQIDKVRVCVETIGEQQQGILEAITDMKGNHTELADKVEILAKEVADGRRHSLWPETERERKRRTEDPKAAPRPRPARAKPTTAKK